MRHHTVRTIDYLLLVVRVFSHFSVLYSKVRAKSKQLRSPQKLRSGKFRSGTKKPRKEEAVPANQSEKAIFPWFTKILNLAFRRATTVVNEPTTEGHDSTSSILTDDQTSMAP